MYFQKDLVLVSGSLTLVDIFVGFKGCKMIIGMFYKLA